MIGLSLAQEKFLKTFVGICIGKQGFPIIISQNGKIEHRPSLGIKTNPSMGNFRKYPVSFP